MRIYSVNKFPEFVFDSEARAIEALADFIRTLLDEMIKEWESELKQSFLKKDREEFDKQPLTTLEECNQAMGHPLFIDLAQGIVSAARWTTSTGLEPRIGIYISKDKHNIPISHIWNYEYQGRDSFDEVIYGPVCLNPHYSFEIKELKYNEMFLET